MNIVVLLIVILLLFGGGGFYLGGPAVGGSLGGLILLVLIVMLVTGRIGSRALEHVLSCTICTELGRGARGPVVLPLEGPALSDMPVHIGAPHPRATATDHLEACSANHMLHRRG
jgi:hypothetical protein